MPHCGCMRTKAHWVCLLFMGCTAALREPRPSADEPLRHALGVAAPRSLHRVLGVDLAVHDSETGATKPVLVALHAIGHGGGDFVGVEAALSSTWRVVTVDWPSQGFSGPDLVPASAGRYADLLAALLDELGVSRAVLLGNSIGGAAAIRFAAAHPERVTALVLANPGGLDPGASGFFGRLLIGTQVGHFEAGARDEARFGPWFADYYAGVLPSPAASEKRAAIVAAGYESAEVLAQAWNSFRSPDAYIGDLLPALRQPVLVAWAKNDGWVQWSRNKAAVERLPNAKVALFDAGHSAFLEAPDAFMNELRPFLARVQLQ